MHTGRNRLIAQERRRELWVLPADVNLVLRRSVSSAVAAPEPLKDISFREELRGALPSLPACRTWSSTWVRPCFRRGDWLPSTKYSVQSIIYCVRDRCQR
jgi:hypothetical protein